MHKDKTYVGIMRLHKEISQKELEKTIEKFIGKITQLPPVRSRVKRAEREREVKAFKILEIDGKDVLFETQVQAGTYIRKLIHDLGLQIGGAHMLELRRTKAGIFTEENLVNLYDFEKVVEEYKKGSEEPLRKIIIPAEEKIKEVLPVVQISSKNIKAILTGKPLMKNDILSEIKEEFFAAFINDKFTGIYKKSNEKNIVARPEFVKN
jgi:H/ACA ribonucleoprotein complex subunit 4